MSEFQESSHVSEAQVVQVPQMDDDAAPGFFKDNRETYAEQSLLQCKMNEVAQYHGGVIQRLVANNLANGTMVFIKRTTSSAMHGEPAEIKGRGPSPNEYVVEVKGELWIARADQLVSSQNELGGTIEADMETISKIPPKKLMTMAREFVTSVLNLDHDFVLGGSFAVLIHAFSAGVGARTPRDIDVILHENDFAKYGSGNSPIETECKLWGIPLELHKNGKLVDVSESEVSSGIVAKDKLLAKELVRLIDKNYLFREIIPLPDKTLTITATELMETIKKANDELMSKGKTDHLEDSSKRVWIKTVADIETLVKAGATLEAYKLEKDPW